MGWWWSQEQRVQQSDESLPDDAMVPASNSRDAISATRRTPSTATEPQSDPSESTAKRVLSRNEQAYEELKTLFAEIDPQRATDAAARAKEYVERPPEDYSNSIYASTMSCSQCFDQAYYCSSVGGQLNNLYRYGAMRSCTEQWAQWRFCMRTKMMSEDTKKTKIREFNQRRAAKYKVGPSSEDVWQVRDEPVENPFSRSMEQSPH